MQSLSPDRFAILKHNHSVCFEVTVDKCVLSPRVTRMISRWNRDGIRNLIDLVREKK